MVRLWMSGGSSRCGGVAGTFRRVPHGIHNRLRSTLSSTTINGLAAHRRPAHTS